MFTKVSKLISDRIQGEISLFQKKRQVTARYEVPLYLRRLFKNFTREEQGFNLGKALDKLSFPALFSLILTSAKLVVSRALNGNHDFLNKFAHHLGRYEKDEISYGSSMVMSTLTIQNLVKSKRSVINLAFELNL